MPKPLVTVVIPVYNRGAYISKAIESVLKQSYPDWKLIVVDDASTDNTNKVVSKYINNKKVKYIQLPHNKGVGFALNIALEHINTPYFIILDSDDWLEPDTLRTLVHEMQKQPPSTSLIYGNMVQWEDKNGKLLRRDTIKYKSFSDKYEFMLYPLMPYPRFFRTSAVKEVNGFEADIPHNGRYGEDRYLLLKLIGSSNFHWIDKNLYNLRKHGNNLTKKENQQKFAEVRRAIVSKILKRWGDQYEPIFGEAGGWLNVKELIRKDGQKERWILNNSKTTKIKLPYISVVIATYNRADLIRRSIDSVLSQTFQNFEIIIVDDASTDHTEEVIASYQDNRLNYRKHTQNLGNTAALKTGVQQASGRYVAFLDSDDEWLPTKLEKQITFIDSIPDKDNIVTYTQLIRAEEDREVIRPKRGKESNESLGNYLFIHYGLMQNSTLVIPRSVLLKTIHLPNPSLHQDWDLCLQLEKIGCPFYFLEEPLTIWHCENRADRISKKIKPKKSLDWIISHKDRVSTAAMNNFIKDYVKPYLPKEE